MRLSHTGPRAVSSVAAVLAAASWALWLISWRAQPAKYEFVDPIMCGACHQKQYSEWEHSLHALAHSEAIYDQYFIKASRDTDGAIQEFCARCHTPLGVLDGHIPFPKPVEKRGDTGVSQTEATGVTCDLCHTVDGYTELRNAQFTVDRSEVKRGPYADSNSAFHQTALSDLITKPEFCGICPTVDHPANGIHLEMTYEEWKNGPYAAEGTRCQDCHMSKTLGEEPHRRPGKATVGGPDRDHVSDHLFVGPNLCFSNVEGAEEQHGLSEQLLRKAAKVEVGEVSVADGQLSVQVNVTNVGAGHCIPTGVTELRQVWLDVVVTDADGKELLHSGMLDDAGEITAGSVIYTTVVHDADGKATTRFWNTVEKASDHRIPPRQTVSETISGPVGDAVNGPLKVSVKLNYRSVSPFGLAEVEMPDGSVTVPVFTMATAEATAQA